MLSSVTWQNALRQHPGQSVQGPVAATSLCSLYASAKGPFKRQPLPILAVFWRGQQVSVSVFPPPPNSIILFTEALPAGPVFPLTLRPLPESKGGGEHCSVPSSWSLYIFMHTIKKPRVSGRNLVLLGSSLDHRFSFYFCLKVNLLLVTYVTISLTWRGSFTWFCRENVCQILSSKQL